MSRSLTAEERDVLTASAHARVAAEATAKTVRVHESNVITDLRRRGVTGTSIARELGITHQRVHQIVSANNTRAQA